MAAPTSPKNADIVAELMNDTLNSMVGTVKESEVESAYRRLRAGVVFDAEAAQQRMMRLGLGLRLPPDGLFPWTNRSRRQRAVTRDDIEQVLSPLVVNDRARVVVGPVE